jgi:hypothetical protein
MRFASSFGSHHFMLELLNLMEIPYPTCLSIMELEPSFQLEIQANGYGNDKSGMLSRFLSPTPSFFWKSFHKSLWQPNMIFQLGISNWTNEMITLMSFISTKTK